MFGRTRRSVRARLAETGLPAGLQDFIARLVARTRLRRDEQMDIAAELSSHFREGLAVGKTADALLASYGEVARSARELRAGAIAKRGPLDRAAGTLMKWSGVGVAVVSVAYLASAAVLYSREPVIAFDARAAANARIPTAGPEGRALDIYIAALADENGRYREEWLGECLTAIEDALLKLDADASAEAEAKAAVRASFADMRGTIDVLRGVRSRPALGLGIEADGLTDDAAVRFFGADALQIADPHRSNSPLASSVLSIGLPQAAMLRRCAKILCFDARIAAMDGRGDDFILSIEAALAAGGHAGEQGFLISRLVEAGIRSMVLETIERAVARNPSAFDDAQFAQLEQIARSQHTDFAVALESEWHLLRDVVQRCYSDDGRGDGVLLPRAFGLLMRDLSSWSGTDGASLGAVRGSAAMEFLAGPLAATVSPSRREVEDRARAYFTKAIAVVSAQTDEEHEARRREFDAIATEPSRSAGGLLEMVMPALDRTLEHPRKLELAAERTADAVRAVRARRSEVNAAAQ
ncbi:MAG: hypothetical protein GC172_08575 [Phycisphaera sp.]|nr:hypothetical protein [Phycisphaera sp.]